MKIRSNRFPLFLFLAIALGSTSLDCLAQESTPSIEQLKEQMKTFKGRLRVYTNCLRRKCTAQERGVAARAAIRDGIIAALLVAMLIKIGRMTPDLLSILRHKKEVVEFNKKREDIDNPAGLFNAMGITKFLEKNYALKPDSFGFSKSSTDAHAQITISNVTSKSFDRWKFFNANLEKFLKRNNIEIYGLNNSTEISRQSDGTYKVTISIGLSATGGYSTYSGPVHPW